MSPPQATYIPDELQMFPVIKCGNSGLFTKVFFGFKGLFGYRYRNKSPKTMKKRSAVHWTATCIHNSSEHTCTHPHPHLWTGCYLLFFPLQMASMLHLPMLILHPLQWRTEPSRCPQALGGLMSSKSRYYKAGQDSALDSACVPHSCAADLTVRCDRPFFFTSYLLLKATTISA